MDEFMIDKREVRRAFSRAARDYDAAAVLQREVCRRMLERLDFIRLQPENILDAGSGTGWGARELLRRYPTAHVLALDMAQGMLQFSRAQESWWKKLFAGRRLSHVCGDVESLPLPPASMDMVWSGLTLQWCNDLYATFQGLFGTLRPEGLLMFSTFGPDTLKELKDAFGDVAHSHVSRFLDMHDVGDMLVKCGFAEPVMDMEIITLTYNDVRAVLEDLRAIGAHNAAAGRARGMMGRGARGRMVENYERFRRAGKLPATFEIVYGHAWKPAPKTAADGAHIIRMDLKR
jgi:malonyl-CoA O-methyltransferase